MEEPLKKIYTPEQVFAENEVDERVRKRQLIAKGLLLASCAVIIIMGIIFLVSLLYSDMGSFTIKIGDLDEKAISLSETAGFANPTIKLSAIPINNMDNITYTDLPVDTLDDTDGSHNGRNYIAYTFYIRNQLDEKVDYSVALHLLKATKGIDNAVRIMVYRDGVPTVYAKKDKHGGTEPVPENVVNFESDVLLINDIYNEEKPGAIRKYTIVAWLEGEDPECVNDILRGIMRFEVNVTRLNHDN